MDTRSSTIASNASIAASGTTSKGGWYEYAPTIQIRILVAIAQMNRVHVEAPDRKSIAGLVKLKYGRSFNTICRKMKQKGLISYPDSKTISLTERGMQGVEAYMPPEPTCNKDYLDEMKSTISRAKVRGMFDVLTDGADHALVELAVVAGYDETNRSFKTYISCLNIFVEKYKGDGLNGGASMIRLKDECFPLGRGVH